MNPIQKCLYILQEKPILNEANLSSIIRKINKDDNAIAILSPFRKENTDEENEIYYEELKYSISEHGWGYLQLNGGWREDKNTSRERMVHEKSVFIDVELEEEKELFRFCKFITRRYNQDAFLFKSPNKPFGAYKKNGKEDFLFKGKQEHVSGDNVVFRNKPETSLSYNKINLKDIEDMYSSLRYGSHKGIKFIFESIEIRNASSLIDAYSRKLWLEK